MKRTLHVFSILSLAAALLGWLAPAGQASAAWCELQQAARQAPVDHACCPVAPAPQPMSPTCALRCAHLDGADQPAPISLASLQAAPIESVSIALPSLKSTGYSTHDRSTHAPPTPRRFALFCTYRC